MPNLLSFCRRFSAPLLLVALSLSGAPPAGPQPAPDVPPCPVLTWNAFPGELSPEGIIQMQVNPAGETFFSVDPDGGNILAVKMGADGRRVWGKFLSPDNETHCCLHPAGLAVSSTGVTAVGGTYTEAPGNPWTGTFVRPYSGNTDLVVMKIKPTGRLAWTTFLGSADLDTGSVGFVDGAGRIWSCGQSAATWGAPVRRFKSARDGFVAVLNPDGSLLWNTFLGGPGIDRVGGLIADGSGGAWVLGASDASWGSPLRSFRSGTDVFVARLDGAGNLLWHTFLGGAGEDLLRGCALTSNGALALVGDSQNDWGEGRQLKPFSAQATRFVARLGATGQFKWNSFFSYPMDFRKVVFAADASFYVLGEHTANWGSPVRAYSGGSDVGVAKFNPTGWLLWNTFLGGPDGPELEPTNRDHALNLAVDALGGVAVAGSSWLPWESPLPTIVKGWDILWVARLSGATGQLQWNAFLGASGTLQETYFTGAALSTLANGDILVAGQSWDDWGAPPEPKDAGSQVSLSRLRAVPLCPGSPAPSSSGDRE